MPIFLNLVAGLFFLTLAILGLLSGSFITFLLHIIFGLTGSAILLGLAHTIIGQDWIMSQIYKVEEKGPKEFIPCPQCGKKFESDRKNCPFCAYRP
ncbi:hypothetical protein F9U64_02420 [Gracilibacillus oryzae]|uniref:Zinc-ribbon domain-containing protein n=1 Tax=Gracilibacillus oryzae TaxID=1672701 RepID=A0A7C8KWI7_9BACI|nr:hypothetical protein [Gracilibacillus oryzae]KAB8138976.1 hypothetical protein F9U64_02420 [Gracilibacillus oryzae]